MQFILAIAELGMTQRFGGCTIRHERTLDPLRFAFVLHDARDRRILPQYSSIASRRDSRAECCKEVAFIKVRRCHEERVGIGNIVQEPVFCITHAFVHPSR